MVTIGAHQSNVDAYQRPPLKQLDFAGVLIRKMSGEFGTLLACQVVGESAAGLRRGVVVCSVARVICKDSDSGDRGLKAAAPDFVVNIDRASSMIGVWLRWFS